MVDFGIGHQMALTGVSFSEESLRARAQALAITLSVPFLEARFNQTDLAGVQLLVTPAGLALAFQNPKRGKPYLIDFLGPSWRARFDQPLGRNHIFRRALGVKDQSITLIDATAGFGQDAVLAASLGCKVTALERDPVVFTLLEDGLSRARNEDELLKERLKNLAVVKCDALLYLNSHRAEVVYLDPMFSKPKKSAKSPKEMQLLQELLVEPPADFEEQLLTSARIAASNRVVVKRPLKARALKTPSHSFKGQSVRYDVYLSET